MSEHLLLVEDDVKLAGLFVELLQGHGWTVTHCTTGEQALNVVGKLQPNLIILDIMLPGIDGIEVCKRLKDKTKACILMLTALGSDADQILGLEFGADDYVVKTAPPRLLIARIRALLRRNSLLQEGESSVIHLGWCEVELTQQRVWLTRPYREEKILSMAEFEVLSVLVQQAGEIVGRETLFEKVFNRPYDSNDRTLDRRIVRLRRSLGDPDGTYIRTARGVGYLAIIDDSNFQES